MSTNSRLNAALAGEVVERPVYAVYDWFVNNRPQVDWKELFRAGLGVIGHADVVAYTQPHLQVVTTEQPVDGGQTRKDVTWITDRGELHEWYLGEWRQEHLVKTAEDYRILSRAFEDQKARGRADRLAAVRQQFGENGWVTGQFARMPLQDLQIDYVGVEQFSVDLAERRPELLALIEQMNALKLEAARAMPADPKYIKLWENMTIEILGPGPYREFLMPTYRRLLEILTAAGKRLLVHYDGKLRAIAKDVAELDFDGIDSLTQAPEGDLTVAEARAFWPEKFLWMHPCLGWFDMPEQEMLRRIAQMVREAGPRRFCVMISEEVPSEWRTRVPRVLEMLNRR